MPQRAHPISCLPTLLVFLAVVGGLPLVAAPPTDKAEIPKSTFVYPTKPADGRDPFFPKSLRPYQDNPDAPKTGPSLADLTLKSILGASPNAFAIINNHTFAKGDAGDIRVKDGQRLHIHCVDINPEAGTATVEADGNIEVLHLSGGL